MNMLSDYTQIYSNAIYNTGGNTLTCDFPVKFFTNKDYIAINYKIYLISDIGGLAEIEIGNMNMGVVCSVRIPPQSAELITLLISPGALVNTLDITCPKTKTVIPGYTDISTIKFSFQGSIYSPAIAMYSAILTTNGNRINNSLEGTKICSNSNPCLPRYTCVGGQCLECDPTCLYCDTEKSRTGCIKMCSPHATTPTPSMGQCLVNYVDVTQFHSLKTPEEEDQPAIYHLMVSGVSPPRKNRLTMTLWIFFANGIENAVTIEVEDFLKMIINTKEFVSAFDLLNGESDFIEATDIKEGRWIFAKCGASIDTQQYSMELVNTGGLDVDKFDNLPSKVVYHRRFFREGDTINVSFQNFDSFEKPVYIRNVYLFRELITKKYFDAKYFYFEKLIYATKDIPELLFAIPFDNLSQSGNAFQTTVISFDTTQRSFNVDLSPKDDFSLISAMNLKRLNLLETSNTKYSSKDLLNTTPLSVFKQKFQMYVFDDDTAFSCIENYYLRQDGTCGKNCEPDFSITAGL